MSRLNRSRQSVRHDRAIHAAAVLLRRAYAVPRGGYLRAVFAVFAAVAALGSISPALAVDYEELTALLRAGIGEAVIEAQIEREGLEFTPDSAQLIALKEAGAGDRLLTLIASAPTLPRESAPENEATQRDSSRDRAETSAAPELDAYVDPFGYRIYHWPNAYAYYCPFPGWNFNVYYAGYRGWRWVDWAWCDWDLWAWRPYYWPRIRACSSPWYSWNHHPAHGGHDWDSPGGRTWTRDRDRRSSWDRGSGQAQASPSGVVRKGDRFRDRDHRPDPDRVGIDRRQRDRDRDKQIDRGRIDPTPRDRTRSDPAPGTPRVAPNREDRSRFRSREWSRGPSTPRVADAPRSPAPRRESGSNRTASPRRR